MSLSIFPGAFGPAEKIDAIPATYVAALYRLKYGVDVTEHFKGVREFELYRCIATGMHLWRPEHLAGDEGFYRQIKAAYPEYYTPWRWEYGLLDPYLRPATRLLEIGCGRGFFLKQVEGRIREAKGIELNREAIADKVTSWDIEALNVETLAAAETPFDVVCAFQVWEHVADPAGFIDTCFKCLRPGGVLALSVPNYENIVFANREDPLDLPPHHMNHFTPDTMRRIANHVGMGLEKVEIQPRIFGFPPVVQRTYQDIRYRIATRLGQKLFDRIYAAAGEPGHTILALFRKPT